MTYQFFTLEMINSSTHYHTKLRDNSLIFLKKNRSQSSNTSQDLWYKILLTRSVIQFTTPKILLNCTINYPSFGRKLLLCSNYLKLCFTNPRFYLLTETLTPSYYTVVSTLGTRRTTSFSTLSVLFV